jgi:NADP-dependent 3-hydroxy acid dehydrogenase YdfG
MSKIELDGAVVAITGAARGIGLATARRFAQRGATVCLGDLDGAAAADAAAEIGPKAHPFTLDVASMESFRGFVADAERAAGPIDVLVNNAGVMPTGRFLDESEATTRTILDVNVAGPIHGMRAVLPGMIARERGHVVNVASMLGKTELAGLATYVASKHAVVGLTAAVRLELRSTGVTLTCVLPAVVNTDLSSGIRMPPGLSWLFKIEPDDVARTIVDTCSARPREVAVPRWMALYPIVRPFIPDVIEDVVRCAIGDDRALSQVDPAERAAYEARIRGQATDRAADGPL